MYSKVVRPQHAVLPLQRKAVPHTGGQGHMLTAQCQHISFSPPAARAWDLWVSSLLEKKSAPATD